MLNVRLKACVFGDSTIPDGIYDVYAIEFAEETVYIKYRDEIIDLDDKFTLLSFSGLYDSFDTEIFEGDCLELTDSAGDSIRAYVRFGYGSFFLNKDGYDLNDIDIRKTIMNSSRVKVVGNIYLNPELRK